MFFIKNGEVDVVMGNTDRIIITLKEGAHFGEMCLIANGLRKNSIRAVDYVDLLFLEREDFEDVCEESTDFYDALVLDVEQRKKESEKAKQRQASLLAQEAGRRRSWLKITPPIEIEAALAAMASAAGAAGSDSGGAVAPSDSDDESPNSNQMAHRSMRRGKAESPTNGKGGPAGGVPKGVDRKRRNSLEKLDQILMSEGQKKDARRGGGARSASSSKLLDLGERGGSGKSPPNPSRRALHASAEGGGLGNGDGATNLQQSSRVKTGKGHPFGANKKRRNSLDKLDKILFSEGRKKEARGAGRRGRNSQGHVDRAKMMATINIAPRRDSAIIVAKDSGIAFPGILDAEREAERTGKRRRNSFDASAAGMDIMLSGDVSLGAASMASRGSSANVRIISKRRGSAADALRAVTGTLPADGEEQAAAASQIVAPSRTEGTTTTPVKPFSVEEDED